jgi:methylmalonyl-CoA mutase C-terminal domain/subunit
MMRRKIRVLVGKPGLDGHDRGAKVVAAALRDAGMEVIYTGLHQTPEQIVEAAVQEDVDVVALSILSGAHMTLFPEVLKLMRAQGAADKLLTGGGIIPPEDMESLARTGVGRLFGPGSSTQDIADYIRAWFVERHGADSLAPAPARPAARPASKARPAASTTKDLVHPRGHDAAIKPSRPKRTARAAAPAKARPKRASTPAKRRAAASRARKPRARARSRGR